MPQRFVTEQWLPFPPNVVFAFFANPANLPPLMPAWQHARIDHVALIPPPAPPPTYGEVPGVYAGSGTQLLITARVAPGVPFRQRWQALIQDFRWGEGFCDLQVKGPFSFWRHCHSVRDAERNGVHGTVVRDEVQYILPLWPLSAPARPLGPMAMDAMFRYRQQQAETLLPTYAQSLGSNA